MGKRKLVPTRKDESLVTGSAEDAAKWVKESKLAAGTKKVLSQFIERFPDVEYYQETKDTYSEVEENQNIKLPAWLKKIRQTLAFVMPGKQVAFQVDKFEGSTPREDNVADIWYSLGLLGYSNDEQRALLEPGKLFPIGYWQGNDSTLAISLDGKKKAVYEFAEEDLRDNQSEGGDPLKSARVVYDDYADLFKHIVALKQGSKVTKAKDGSS